jgi:uncharacterized Zn-finger protein
MQQRSGRGCDAQLGRYDRASPRFSGQNMPIEPPEIIVVNGTRVSCDGSGGALGHPRVYLEMGDQNFVECGYCDRRFVLSPEAIEAREKGEAVAH